jgi:WD40 repeat protein
MADNLIAIAMEDGSINLYNLKDTATRKFIEEPKKLVTLTPPAKVAGTAGPTMSTTLSSTGVEKRRFPLQRQAIAIDLTAHGPPSGSSSTASQRLLAQIQENIYLWDLSRPEAPIQTLKTSITSTRAARWCPLSPGQSQISRGSTNGTVKIYDLKSRDPNTTIWSVKKAHHGSIRDIAWNPFIPYWFATAGSDSIIQIWDTRFGGKPVRTLEDHSNAVNTISWSPTNVELLASGGADRRFKLWNLRSEPHYVISNLGVWDSSIVGVGWAQTRPNAPAFAVSATGIVQACLPQSEFLLSMIPSLDGPQKDAIKNVERSIYTRNFAVGFQKAYQLAQQFLAENRITQANKLLNICYQRPEVTETAFPKDKTTTASASASTSTSAETSKPAPIEMRASITKEQFEKDLLFYSYYIPPNYPDHLWPAVDQKLMFSIEALKMSIDLEQLIRDEDAVELVKIQPDVADFMKRDPTSVDIPLLFRLFSVLLPADFLCSLELGYQLARVFTKNTTSFYGIANMLMFPTLYDTNLNRDAIYGEMLKPNGSVTSRKESLNGISSSDLLKAAATTSGTSTPGTETPKSAASSASSTATSSPTASVTPTNAPISVPTGVTSHKLYVGIQNAASALNTEITSSFLGEQLEFQYKFYKTLWGNNPKDVLDIFDANTVCLSATTWRIYLNMLTLHRQYDKLFIRGSKLGERVKGFPFADILGQLLADVVPRIQKYLRDATSLGMSIAGGSNSSRNARDTAEFNDSNDSESVQSVSRLGRASNMVLNILHNSDARYLPKTLVATLPSSLHQLTVDLETSIREVVDEDNSLEESEKLVRVSAALRTISNNLTTVIGKREPAGQFTDAINEYRTMIENNVRNYNSGASSSGGPPPVPLSSVAKKGAAGRGRVASVSVSEAPRVKKDLPSPDPKK